MQQRKIDNVKNKHKEERKETRLRANIINGKNNERKNKTEG